MNYEISNSLLVPKEIKAKLVNVVHKVQLEKQGQEEQMVYKAIKDCKVSKVNVDEMESLDRNETTDLLAHKV